MNATELSCTLRSSPILPASAVIFRARVGKIDDRAAELAVVAARLERAEGATSAPRRRVLLRESAPVILRRVVGKLTEDVG